MGVYIKGLQMPKDREIILRIDEKGEVYAYGSYPTEIHEAVELPDHGDLIDRDALMSHKGSAYDIDGHELYAVGTGTILRMPVIIPAERSEE